MAEETKQDGKVDHKAEAVRIAAEVGQGYKDVDLAQAQLHASLAIAEQLERLNWKLNAMTGTDPKGEFGTRQQFVRTHRV